MKKASKRQKISITIPKKDYSFFLPEPVLQIILSSTDIKSLGRCQAVCTTFYHTIQERHSIWKKVYCETWKSTKFDLMDERNWREETEKRCAVEKLCNFSNQKLQKHAQDLILFSSTDAADDLVKVVDLLMKPESLPQLRDIFRVKAEFKKNRIPQWLAEGTYFDPKSDHTFAYGNMVEEQCDIQWSVYGATGEQVLFEFSYSCSGYSDECEPYASVSFRTDTQPKVTLVNVTKLRDNKTPVGEATKSFNLLKSILADDKLTPNTVFRYVTCCSRFRQRFYNGKVQSQYFFNDIASTQFASMWPSIYYDREPEDVEDMEEDKPDQEEEHESEDEE